MSEERLTITDRIIDWRDYQDEKMSLADFFKPIDEARLKLGVDEFATARVEFEAIGDYEAGGSFQILVDRRETDEEMSVRLERERQASERREAQSLATAAARELHDRAILRSLILKYGRPTDEELAGIVPGSAP